MVEDSLQGESVLFFELNGLHQENLLLFTILFMRNGFIGSLGHQTDILQYEAERFLFEEKFG